MDKLKPCPFCGCDGKGLSVGIMGEDGEVVLWCICGASVFLPRECFSNKFQEDTIDEGELDFSFKGLDPIIRKWNRRSSDAK